MAHNESEGRPSEARDRLLSTATRVFYAEGIHSVGVDRIVKEAQVTRATFYRHFPSKETLVLAYLTEADRALRGQTEAAVAAGLPAPDTLRAIGAAIAHSIQSPASGAAPSSTPSPSTPTPRTRSTRPSSRTVSGSWTRSPASCARSARNPPPARPATSSCCATARWRPAASSTRSWCPRPSSTEWRAFSRPRHRRRSPEETATRYRVESRRPRKAEWDGE